MQRQTSNDTEVRRSAQPRNSFALKHGFYTRHRRADEAAELQEPSSQTLDGNVALTRMAARWILELLEAERTVEGKTVLATVTSNITMCLASLRPRST